MLQMYQVKGPKTTLLVGYAILEDLVSIFSVHRCRKSTNGHDLSDVIRASINDGNQGRYYDLSIMTKQMMGSQEALSWEGETFCDAVGAQLPVESELQEEGWMMT
uniref:Uncharacterized protein n=1 Tax=Romanomermis culicivorax TaxID=13658 RepID=A0A915I2A6_ROMCU